MKVTAVSLCLAALLASVGAAQEQSRPGASRAILQRLPGASLQEAPPGRTATIVHGPGLAQGTSPLDSGAQLLERTRAALGVDERSLELDVTADGRTLVEVGGLGRPRFFALRFRQVQDGVPVFRSGVGVLVRDEPGYPVVLSSFDVKDVSGVDLTAARAPGAGEPTAAMLQAVGRLFDQQLATRGVPLASRVEPIEASEQRLVVYAGTEGAPSAPTLALEFIAARGSVEVDAGRFQRQRVLASLATGEVLLAEDQIQQFTDVNGTISGRATQGFNSLECDPEAVVGLPYAEATVVGGNTVFADANGQFTIPHPGTTQVTVRSRLRGQYFIVSDDTLAGATPELTTLVTPPGPASIIHNPAPGSQFPNAGVNAYVEANFVRDYVLQYVPSFPTISTQTGFGLYVNEDSAFGITSCNAVYTGTNLTFWRNAGGCNNSAFSDVVYHEYGHHLISVTGNGQGQMGEGSGDVMGVLIQDDPILGQGFQTCGVGIRNASNTMQYPCGGEVHDCGQLISACVWSLRNQLVVTEPVDYKDLGASLFLNMLIVRGMMVPGSTTIDPLITIIYLTLDDDDANIGNGTPHYPEIAAAFGAHNMDAPPLQLVEFAYPSGRPEILGPGGNDDSFTMSVGALTEMPIADTGVLYIDRGMGVETFPMPQLASNLYTLDFPALTLPCGSPVSWYVSVEATPGQTVFDPPGAPGVRFQAFTANSIATAFEDNFETNLSWTVSSTAVDGMWQRAIPAGGGDRGDPPTDADGSGRCYVTDNADGNSDVDDGATILTSPVLDASGAGTALIAYWRWYSNNTGTVTDDVFVVQISNNGGSTWMNLETVGVNDPEASGGWYEKVFKISDVLTPTSNMRVRFNASDLGGGSIVEAGVDDVRILHAICTPRRFLPSGPPRPLR